MLHFETAATAARLLNVVDGCIPSDLAAGTAPELEKERRLLYVAMTPAKDNLHLIVPQRFFTHGQPVHGDRYVYAARTRFISLAVLQHFDCVAWPVAAQMSGWPAEPRRVPIDVGARMRGMWR